MSKKQVKYLAASLYELTRGKKKGEIDGVISSFVEYLGKRQMIRLAPQIIENYRNYFNRQENQLDVKITSRYPLNDSQQETLLKKLKQRFPDNELNFEASIDKKMLGGVRLQIEDLIIDYSLDGKLKQLQTYLINKI